MSNRLAEETSPYLQQHAENPVDWYPWGEDAFRRAREENKPIHLSVGYIFLRAGHLPRRMPHSRRHACSRRTPIRGTAGLAVRRSSRTLRATTWSCASHRTREPALLRSLELTLDHMAAGGIYDHLGGGFARYSVDERWAVPHFEKMLYDNGQMVKLYADAYRLTGNRKWKRIFEETIAYVLRDMTHPEGGFYASEDADSEGEEGKFYVWTPAEAKVVLGDTDGATACRAYGVTERGNFEHGVSCDAHEMSLMAGLVTLCDSIILSNLGE